MGLIIVFLMRQPERQFDKAPSDIQFNLVEILTDIKILILSCASFMMFFLFSSIRSTMIPLYGSEYLGLSSFQIGFIFSFTSAIIVFGLLFLNPRLAQLVKRSLLLSVSLVICSVAVFLIAFSMDFYTLVLYSMPLGIGFSLLQPLPFTMITDYTNPESRGLTIGFSRTIADLGIILGPTLVGWIIDLGQPLLVFYLISGILSLFSFVIWYVFRETHTT
jgi:MFS family permease